MAFARVTDPATSHEAADSVKDITVVQSTILGIIGGDSMSDERLVVEYQKLVRSGIAKPATDQSIRSRRSELARQGLVSVVGYTVTTSGRRAQVWEATNV
jgi:hypothetical protein